jgi:hypothetical protein
MNPQRKKACVVARRRMEERQQQKQKGGGGDSAAPAPAAVAEDPFTRSLTGILSSSGGVVQERHLALLLQLIKRAQTKPHRTALLVVLQLSAPEVLRRAVACRVLLDLQLWLNDFVAEGSQPMVQKTLACLDKLPVTLAALQPPCELGKLVGRLRKHASFGSPVIEPAKGLVARWKAMVDGAVKAGGGGGDASARSDHQLLRLPTGAHLCSACWMVAGRCLVIIAAGGCMHGELVGQAHEDARRMHC